MPVPVPCLSKPPSHPVIKHKHPVDFQSLAKFLPPCPTRAPPSFGPREDWKASLPAWCRDKPRRVWEDILFSVDHPSEQGFQRGLAVADNASVIKGAHAEACIPPLYTLLKVPTFDQYPLNNHVLGDEGDEDDEMGSDYSLDHSHLDNLSQWTASSPLQDIEDVDIANFEEHQTGDAIRACAPAFPLRERRAFSPISEDRSPEDPSSSPLEPVTPFGIFIDRAVASAQTHPSYGNTCPPGDTIPACGLNESKNAAYQTFAPFSLNTFGDVPKEPAPAAENPASSINAGYKKFAEPLANWVADYVWKVCTTGLSLPLPFVTPYAPVRFAASPPSYLAASIHSLLLSTLLQPSAVFLAIWYIIRLPVYFGPIVLEPEYRKEAAFRVALLGDPLWGSDKTSMEASAPFRLVVLGCMLANKWLDDHTFSNKTWHSISNVPTHVLNTLETLALDAFSYDLSVPSREWSQWLTHLLSYHKSLSSPGHPQPISRPSSSPHGIIRKTIEEVIDASTDTALSASIPQPVFIGLEERRREKLEKELQASEVLEIDLDEDGPLREEYMPRRRASGSRRDSRLTEVAASQTENSWDRRNDVTKNLPPPAKWSPAGDEPILRERNRVTGQYVAVQPPHLVASSVVYTQPPDIVYNSGWNSAAYLPIKPQHNYILDFQHVSQSQNVFSYPYVPSIPLPHSRSQSLSYTHENQMHNHSRSHSQTASEYRCSDIRMTANEPETQWPNGYAYSAVPPFGTVPALQTTWLRT